MSIERVEGVSPIKLAVAGLAAIAQVIYGVSPINTLPIDGVSAVSVAVTGASRIDLEDV
jgi:hypothetical protein